MEPKLANTQPLAPMPGFEIVSCRLVANGGSLKGHVTLRFDFGLEVTAVAVFENERGRWCQWPSEPQRDRDGRPQRDANGKVRYRSPIAWVDKRDQRRWSDKVLFLLEDRYPGALEGGEQ